VKISIQEAIEDVDIAFQQVEYCLKANAFWEREGFTADQFVTDLIVTLPKGDLHFPTDRFAEKRNIIIASEIAITVAYGCTVLTLDQALETAGYSIDSKSNDEFDQIRCVVYLMRCAFAHRIAQPYWDVRPQKQRVYRFMVSDRQISVDTGELNGREFYFTHIGGHKVWHDLKHVIINKIRAQQGKCTRTAKDAAPSSL
jgi:hypothetical protein